MCPKDALLACDRGSFRSAHKYPYLMIQNCDVGVQSCHPHALSETLRLSGELEKLLTQDCLAYTYENELAFSLCLTLLCAREQKL